MRTILLVGLGLLAMAAASPPDCVNDIDCRSERVCESGRCIYPIATRPPPSLPLFADPPAPAVPPPRKPDEEKTPPPKDDPARDKPEPHPRPDVPKAGEGSLDRRE